MHSPSAAEDRHTASGFVTLLAWSGVGVAGLATLAAVLLNLSLWLPYAAFGLGGVVEAFESSPRFFFSLLVICATTLAAAVGLLRRRNWARVLFMGLMGIAAVWALGGGLLFQFILSVNASAAEGGDQVSTGARVLLAAAALVIAGGFGWIIRKLRSAEVRAEFSDR